MEKIDIKGFIFRDFDEDGNEIKIKASWVVGNKNIVNYHWLNYGDGSVDKVIYGVIKKGGKAHTNKEIYAQAELIIEAIQRDCLDELIKEMTKR